MAVLFLAEVRKTRRNRGEKGGRRVDCIVCGTVWFYFLKLHPVIWCTRRCCWLCLTIAEFAGICMYYRQKHVTCYMLINRFLNYPLHHVHSKCRPTNSKRTFVLLQTIQNVQRMICTSSSLLHLAYSMSKDKHLRGGWVTDIRLLAISTSWRTFLVANVDSDSCMMRNNVAIVGVRFWPLVRTWWIGSIH